MKIQLLVLASEQLNQQPETNRSFIIKICVVVFSARKVNSGAKLNTNIEAPHTVQTVYGLFRGYESGTDGCVGVQQRNQQQVSSVHAFRLAVEMRCAERDDHAYHLCALVYDTCLCLCLCVCVYAVDRAWIEATEPTVERPQIYFSLDKQTTHSYGCCSFFNSFNIQKSKRRFCFLFCFVIGKCRSLSLSRFSRF